MSKNRTASRLTCGIIVIVLLSLCLCLTTLALVYSSVTVDNNFFHTGEVKIDLNGGQPVIREHEFLFEPGMTVTKSFYVQNDSTGDVWYRLYFSDVSGGLADVLEVTVSDEGGILYFGTATTLGRDSVSAAEQSLAVGERRTLTISFHYPESAGNGTQNSDLNFTLRAEATQTKNNPNRLFG